MSPSQVETKSTLIVSDESHTKRNYSRQSSVKRRNSENDLTFSADDIPYKRRPVADNYITCPLADFGCLTEVPCDSLSKHYSSKIHQECLMKAVELYARQSYNQEKNDSTLVNNDNDYSELVDCVDTLAGGVSCLHDDNIRIHTNMVQIQNTILQQQKQIEQLKSSVEETSQLLHATQLNNDVFQSQIESMKQSMMDALGQSSNDGTYIWKITDVAQKIRDAINEKQASIYSPPFYSSPTGYKMCMRLYLNGDGQARRTHLSLFFVIMRGEYDAILEWPFSFKITFCLFDQTGNQRHIIDSFRPDIKSNSFQRPRSDMNIASGLPKFCPLQFIHQDNNPYLRDDCIFIRCMVDFTSTPKTMISYICSINPGLPKLVQQSMIQTEMQRRNAETSQVSNSEVSSPEKKDS